MYSFDGVDRTFGVPARIHSDQGPCFTSQRFQEFCDRFGMQHFKSAPYHPQGNGKVERLNRSLGDALAKLVEETQRDWHQRLPEVQLALNSAIHDSIKDSPFHVSIQGTPTHYDRRSGRYSTART
eukprot:m.39733 g.39733  ORF g.39733 m.39733 type:complete len:125 (+) comp32800_c0_seq1:387-761(+)